MKNYKVSIICAVRDEAPTFEECIISLINQTYRNKEIIIIDHESTDGTTELAKVYAKKYSWVKYYFLKHDPTYILEARVEGVKKSTGDVIFVVDGDAKYEPAYLETCMKHIDKKGVGGVFGKIRVWRKSDTFISRYRDAHYRLRWDNVKNMEKEAAAGKIAPWIFKKSTYIQLGGYRKEAGWSADVDFGKRMLAAGHTIAYEPSVQWWHRWKEGFFEVMGYALFWSRLDYGKKKPVREIAKMTYFALFLPFVILSFFFPVLWWLVLLHVVPLMYTGLKLYRKATEMHVDTRHYLLLTPVISYITNIPYAYGYLSNYLWR